MLRSENFVAQCEKLVRFIRWLTDLYENLFRKLKTHENQDIRQRRERESKKTERTTTEERRKVYLRPEKDFYHDKLCVPHDWTMLNVVG